MAKQILTGVLYVFGCALIIAGFILFGKRQPEDVRILDTVVSYLLFTQCMAFGVVPWMRAGSDDNPRASSLGLQICTVAFSTIFALAIMITGAFAKWQFKYQLISQLAVLFFTICGYVWVLSASGKTKAVYDREQAKLGRRELLDRQFGEVINAAAAVGMPDNGSMRQLRELRESLRYLTPSSAPEAAAAERRIFDSLKELRSTIGSCADDEQMMAQSVASLARLMAIRKELR